MRNHDLPMNPGGKVESGKRKAKTRESSSCSSFVLDFGGRLGTKGSWSQCASEIRRSGLPMNLTFGNSKLLAFSPLTRLRPTGYGASITAGSVRKMSCSRLPDRCNSWMAQ